MYPDQYFVHRQLFSTSSVWSWIFRRKRFSLHLSILLFPPIPIHPRFDPIWVSFWTMDPNGFWTDFTEDKLFAANGNTDQKEVLDVTMADIYYLHLDGRFMLSSFHFCLLLDKRTAWEPSTSDNNDPVWSLDFARLDDVLRQRL